MFTGLVEEIGTMKSVSRQGEAMVLGIRASKIMEDIALGDSISVNGVCLTVTGIGSSSFNVDVMPQTYKHTNLNLLSSGQKVNLERAMPAGGRFGGHIVQGHVDGTGSIVSTERDYNAVVYTIKPHNPGLFKYIVSQGSITVDGISLTVAKVQGETFSVSIIPHTLAETALAFKRPGDTVNLECDVIGKYVEHLLHYRGSSSSESSAGQARDGKELSLSFLSENGFV
ncbi:riboflavin synthase [Paenibacillus caui]|uniref:riboflavin synthase n=1 Tax=Paenibacillus caui TaxID=2873927 RepID=UPI001CA80384|nr:riboflavin synthase [Paenibacillus caui]